LSPAARQSRSLEMTSTSTLWLFPLIAAGGVLQAVGGPMNNALRVSLVNPWLATLVSFGLIVPIFLVIAAVFVRPLPTVAGIAGMPWWAPLGGIVGALAVVCGLLFIGTIGAGTYAALTVSANLITSLVIDHYGWLSVPAHPITPTRAIGAVVLVTGVILITST
jgi:transporter family-2 protein